MGWHELVGLRLGGERHLLYAFRECTRCCKEGNLYVGGRFTMAGGIEVNGIAKWNGSAWSALGAGVGNGPYVPDVNALAIDQVGKCLRYGVSLPRQEMFRLRTLRNGTEVNGPLWALVLRVPVWWPLPQWFWIKLVVSMPQAALTMLAESRPITLQDGTEATGKRWDWELTVTIIPRFGDWL